MAAALTTLLCTLLLLYFVVEGKSLKCDTSNVDVQTTNKGQRTGFDFMFEVEVKNRCSCAIWNVYLEANGFSSQIMVDPKLFREQRFGYLVNNGDKIPSMSSVKFQYAWDHYFPMSPISLQYSTVCKQNEDV